MLVGTDVAVQKPEFVVFDQTVGILEVRLPRRVPISLLCR